ncbi:hypothetical protein MAIT1_00189 [Magnetofaba australis IT-1]|uniref:Uncharacterized protein n=2 Tax=Magnetofaba TaxID=1472292 RepID=A0A1Y2K8Z2_9PROT|nr:hypothetical protein MAIT1_00189 [Magnetofaba australis IT-1]
MNTLAALFELSLGLAAWKSISGQRWALRCNPSSGNLHPTEGYLVMGGEPTHGAPLPHSGVYHYNALNHTLEQRAELDPEEAAACLPEGTFLLGLSSIHWREEWKYGERAYRYCQLDVGHAIAGVRYAAAALGWRVLALSEPADGDTLQLLGLDQSLPPAAAEVEVEAPDLLLWIDTRDADDLADDPDLDPHPPSPERIADLAGAAAGTRWQGDPNKLSGRHSHEWPIVAAVSRATFKGVTESYIAPPTEPPPMEATPTTQKAADLIRNRRSAQSFDANVSIDRDAFYRILDRLVPRPGIAPWDAQSWPLRLHPMLFVHRVRGLPAGLYALPRSESGEMALRESMRETFAWVKPDTCPESLNLYLLAAGDLREHAKVISCSQDIASDSAFSLGMLAEFDSGLEPGSHGGPHGYRQMYWEAGMLGQALYLGAEAEGVNGTGIGCFLDDLLHEILTLEGTRMQSLYHFTVGGGLEDDRLTTEPPYGHLSDRPKAEWI